MLHQNLDHFDGIICCGGDGTFSELFNGLIYREILKANDPSKFDVENIPKQMKPLGIIPAGSTDTVAYCLHGTADIKTCLIHIILGQTTGLDLSSVSNDKGIIKFYASVMSYGYFGDLMRESDRFRWLGPKRYDYAGFKKFLLNRGYDVELLLLEESETTNTLDMKTTREKIKCFENCSICSATDFSSNPSSEEKFKRIIGKFFVVNGANISCACKRSPLGFSPYQHLGDGFVDVILIRHGSLWQNLKLLMTLTRGEIESLPFVELYRTRKFLIKALNSSSDRSENNSSEDSTLPISVMPSNSCSVWNCDGEILQETDVTIRWVKIKVSDIKDNLLEHNDFRSHRQLITVYRRGAVAETSETVKNCCLP